MDFIAFLCVRSYSLIVHFSKVIRVCFATILRMFYRKSAYVLSQICVCLSTFANLGGGKNLDKQGIPGSKKYFPINTVITVIYSSRGIFSVNNFEKCFWLRHMLRQKKEARILNGSTNQCQAGTIL